MLEFRGELFSCPQKIYFSLHFDRAQFSDIVSFQGSDIRINSYVRCYHIPGQLKHFVGIELERDPVFLLPLLNVPDCLFKSVKSGVHSTLELMSHTLNTVGCLIHVLDRPLQIGFEACQSLLHCLLMPLVQLKGVVSLIETTFCFGRLILELSYISVDFLLEGTHTLPVFS